jgi:hypothetical protein
MGQEAERKNLSPNIAFKDTPHTPVISLSPSRLYLLKILSLFNNVWGTLIQTIAERLHDFMLPNQKNSDHFKNANH